MNYLVTGATGFVGRSLCSRLIREGERVHGAVRSPDKAACLVPGVEPVFAGPLGAETLWHLESVDAIIHLAARVHVMNDDAEDPLAEFRKVNVQGTEALARQAAAHGVRRFVFVSSVKVHGEESDVPYTEADDPAPLDPYGVSKLEAEGALRKVAAETKLEVVIIRPPLVYGPGVKANFFNLLRAVEKGLPLPLSAVNNERSMVFLGNLVDAIVFCARHPETAGRTYLVSDRDDVSTPELLRRMAVALHRPSRLLPFPPALIRLVGKLTGRSTAADRLLGSLVVDSGKIQRELGWTPPYRMAEGLSETAAWFQEQLQKPSSAADI